MLRRGGCEGRGRDESLRSEQASGGGVGGGGAGEKGRGDAGRRVGGARSPTKCSIGLSWQARNQDFVIGVLIQWSNNFA